MLRKYLLLSVIMLIANGVVFANEETHKDFSKNIITTDVLTILPALLFLTESEFTFTFISTAIQYENQISNIYSMACRLGYRGYYDSENNLAISTFSLEGHFRGYPGGEVFFLDGMLGYTYLDFYEKNESTEAHFFVIGGKLGWRIDFEQASGFILEPSLGYYIPYGKTNLKSADDAIVKLLFAGGLQVSLNIGYRF